MIFTLPLLNYITKFRKTCTKQFCHSAPSTLISSPLSSTEISSWKSYFFRNVDQTLVSSKRQIFSCFKKAQDMSLSIKPESASNNQRNNISPLLKKLMLNAEKNVQTLPKQRQYNELLQMFATSLLIIAGPLSYKFVHRIMPEALYSLRRVECTKYGTYQLLHE